jgi:hypothetical protein
MPEVKAAESHVYISEVAWAGSSLSTSDEWIELVNPTDQDVTLSDWKIVGAGSSNKNLVLPDDALIPAGGAYLIANYPAGDAHCSLTVEPNVVTSTISLSNSNLQIQLIDNNGQLVDQAGDGHAPPAGYSSDIKASMIRVDYLMSGDLKDAWQTAESSQNLKTPDLGTPGVVDIDEPAPTPPPSEELPSATSTEPIVDESPTATTTDEFILPSPTSTDDTLDVVLPDVSSSSTDTTTSTAVDCADARFCVSTSTTATTTEITAPVDLVPIETSSQPNYQYLRLNEVMPDPASGPEWVEITNAMPDRSISLDLLELHDAVGKFMTLKGSVTSGHLYVVINLSSARLNNSGDSLYLKTPDGMVIDTLTYASSHEGVSWARDMQGAWRETVTPTPGAENAINETVVAQDSVLVSKYEPVTPKKKTPAKTVKSTTVKTTAKAATSTSAVKSSSAPTKKSTAAKVTATATEKKTTVASTKTAVKKTTTTKSTSSVKAPTLINFDMLQDDSYGGIRVKLQGMAGSPAGLLTGRSFVLLNPEGRGLLIKVPSGQKMPALGTPLEVTGTLKFDTHDFPYLSLTKNDKISELKKSASSIPRAIMWLAPALEDAWSLASASGTVQSVSGSTISLLVDDAEVDLKIKSGVGYRASRLKKGDIVSVTGILDMTSQRVAILPRQAEEIILAGHAPDSVKTSDQPVKTSGLPGWTPFGAALGAIGAVEGVKKLKSRKKAKVTATV